MLSVICTDCNIDIWLYGGIRSVGVCIPRVSYQNGVSLLYIMLEIHHSGREPSILDSDVYVPADEGCGGTLTGTEGTVTSPNYPDSYNHNEDCVWIITVPDSDNVVLQFNHFGLEGGTSCQYDFVEVKLDQQKGFGLVLVCVFGFSVVLSGCLARLIAALACLILWTKNTPSSHLPLSPPSHRKKKKDRHKITDK